jgi:hypothetical protein
MERRHRLVAVTMVVFGGGACGGRSLSPVDPEPCPVRVQVAAPSEAGATAGPALKRPEPAPPPEKPAAASDAGLGRSPSVGRVWIQDGVGDDGFKTPSLYADFDYAPFDPCTESSRVGACAVVHCGDGFPAPVVLDTPDVGPITVAGPAFGFAQFPLDNPNTLFSKPLPRALTSDDPLVVAAARDHGPSFALSLVVPARALSLTIEGCPTDAPCTVVRDRDAAFSWTRDGEHGVARVTLTGSAFVAGGIDTSAAFVQCDAPMAAGRVVAPASLLGQLNPGPDLRAFVRTLSLAHTAAPAGVGPGIDAKIERAGAERVVAIQ